MDIQHSTGSIVVYHHEIVLISYKLLVLILSVALAFYDVLIYGMLSILAVSVFCSAPGFVTYNSQTSPFAKYTVPLTCNFTKHDFQ